MEGMEFRIYQGGVYESSCQTSLLVLCPDGNNVLRDPCVKTSRRAPKTFPRGLLAAGRASSRVPMSIYDAPKDR